MRFIISALAVSCLLGIYGGVAAEISCYSCNSESDINCATFKVSPDLKVCAPAETECAVTVLGRHTIRGCKSEVELAIASTCTGTSCGVCNSDNCNSMIWPENRLQCHKCSTCDYIENDNRLEVCEDYLSGDQCYLVVDQVANTETATVDIVTHRGCMSTKDEGSNYCWANLGKCFPCATPGCNKEPSYAESTLTCHKCDSTKDPNCIFAQQEGPSEKCDYNKLLGAPESCYTYTYENGDVIRGCLMELAATNGLRKECEGSNEKCQTCSGADCNSKSTEKDYGSCVLCDGDADPNCATLEESYATTKCGEHPVGGCFRANIHGKIVRSCVSDLLPEEVEMCQKGDDCKICYGDLCNAKVDYSICHKCDSKTDGNCVEYQNGGEVTCKDYMDTCAAYIDLETGATIRGCNKELLDFPGCSEHADYCVNCDRNYCNAAPIPWWRLRCHQCDGLDCAIVNLNTAKYCKNYQDNEECYSVTAVVDGQTKVHRGCMSDEATDVGKALCDSEAENCAKCTRSDCNSLSYTFTSQLSCHVCDSTKDANCEADKTTSQATRCGYELGVGRTDHCYQHFDGMILNRGCLHSAPEDIKAKCESGSAECQLCGVNGCNAEKFETNGQCYFCDGSDGSNCDTLNGVTPIYCPAGSQGCFRSQLDGKVVRGCLSQLVPGEVSLCESGRDCKLCQGDNCNGKVNFQSCYNCNSASDPTCAIFSANENSVMKTCTDYLDQCVTYFNNGVVYRGCRNEHDFQCPSGSCTVCTNNNCNTQPPIAPSQLSCYQCDSEKDVNCLMDQPSGQSSVCDYSLVVGRPDQCYLHYDGEKVSRGCIYNAPFEIQSKCLGGSSECKLCTTAECNAEKVDHNGLCYFCDGTKDANCAALTGYSPIHCPAGDRKGCFRSQIDGVVTRGCISQLVAGEVALCERGRDCKFCEGDNCNGKVDYQTCFSCNSATDPGCAILSVNEETPRKTCNDYYDECVTYFNNGVVYRGCRKEADVTCPSGSCTVCVNNECNTQPPIAPSQLTCHQCDAADDASCTNAQTSSQSTRCDYSLVVGRPDQCYEFYDGETAARGCLYDAPFEIQYKCLGGGTECKLCGTAGCNSEEIATNGQCYSCDGAVGDNCDTLEGVKSVLCPAGERKGCFRSQVDNKVVRGCISQLLPGEVSLCEAGRVCKFCEGDNCNGKLKFQECYTCNSLTDPKCLDAQLTNSVKTTCRDYLDECVTYIGAGTTYRGCRAQSQLPTPCPSATCAYCSGENCNSLVFPSNRIRCYQCSGNAENCVSKLDIGSSHLTLCKNYIAGDACYTTVTADRSSVYRGCMSDEDVGSKLCADNGDSCPRCLASGCNSVPAVSSASLSCVSCAASDVNCAWGYSSAEVEMCKADVWLGETETCYRIQSEDGSAQRGCTMDTNKCEECELCTGNACNAKSYNKHKCYQCDSKLAGQETCAKEAEDLLITECPGDDQKLSDIGCYMLKKEDGSVERGCMKDMNAELLTVCKSDDDEVCQYCGSDGCNNQNAGAAAIKALSLIAIIAIAGFRLVMN